MKRTAFFALIAGFSLGIVVSVTDGAIAQDGKNVRASSPAVSQTPEPGQMPAWLVTCSNANAAGELRCRAQQTLSVTQTRQRLVSVSFEHGVGGRVQGRVALPHGVQIPPGVDVWVDEGKRRTIPIVSADENGSYADLPGDQEFISSLKSGSTMRIKAKTVSNDDLVMELTLSAISSALKLVENGKN
jgi:invasion protein IalB